MISFIDSGVLTTASQGTEYLLLVGRDLKVYNAHCALLFIVKLNTKNKFIPALKQKIYWYLSS